MKKHTLIMGNLALFLLAGLSIQAAEATRFDGKPGSKVRIEGTSNIHDWRVVGTIIGGWIETGANFPIEAGQAATPGKAEAKAEVFIPVRTLKSKKEDGSPYSDKMDEIMYEKLQPDPKFARITYRLTELTLKEVAKGKDAPYVFDSKGELVVAGVTNTISMPVNVLPMADKKLKITGSVEVKMTDYKIDPPAPKIALGLIKTGDPVKLIFEWIVAQKAAKPAGQ